ncbi:glycosyl hydrolase family 65 protein [Paenibacillus macerans]|uniref:glycosyl hydrolase family 65 protein n=1 Tax=Paenibacillus macerans TaxID=44252 RepID=UPI003D31858D
MANLLNDYDQEIVGKADYFNLLNTYAKSHYRTREDGTGQGLNHSTFNDLVITGLIGIRPREDDVLVVRPLVPEEAWNYFCLDQLDYHGHTVTVAYDRDGTRYGKGKGLRIYVDGNECAAGDLGDAPFEIPLKKLPSEF